MPLAHESQRLQPFMSFYIYILSKGSPIDMEPTIGENRRLVTDEPVGIEK
jgi:hypothetical protein